MTSGVALAKPGREATTKLIKNVIQMGHFKHLFQKKSPFFGVLSMKIPESYF